MKINCVWEHNGDSSLLYANNFAGAFTRGASKEEAILKMPEEIRRFQLWQGDTPLDDYDNQIRVFLAFCAMLRRLINHSLCFHPIKP